MKWICKLIAEWDLRKVPVHMRVLFREEAEERAKVTLISLSSICLSLIAIILSLLKILR